MKLALSAVIIMAWFSSIAQYPSQNIDFRSNWFDPVVVSEPVYEIKYSSCWGYAAAGREYGIIGSTAGTYIIEVTDPVNPVLRDYVAGRRDSCIWREFKTYQNYLYMVSDDGGPNSFQIADLSYLPDSIHLVHDSTNIFERAHTIFVVGDKLYCGSVSGTAVGGYSTMNVYSLADPANPTLLRRLDQDFPFIGQVHDMFVRNDTVYASCGNDGLYIFKFTASNNFTLLGSITIYNFQGYNHSSFINPSGGTLVFADEVPTGLPMKVYDISDLSNITFKSNFQTHVGATPHNPYMVGEKTIIAYYEDGVYVYDLQQPENPVLAGFFDTHPQNGTTYNGYRGCWAIFTDLPSKNLLASDMQNGLFVLNADSLLFPSTAIKPRNQEKAPGNISVFPNPSNGNFKVELENSSKQAPVFSMTDLSGRNISVFSEKSSSGKYWEIAVKNYSDGYYILNVNDGNSSYHQAIILRNTDK